MLEFARGLCSSGYQEFSVSPGRSACLCQGVGGRWSLPISECCPAGLAAAARQWVLYLWRSAAGQIGCAAPMSEAQWTVVFAAEAIKRSAADRRVPHPGLLRLWRATGRGQSARPAAHRVDHRRGRPLGQGRQLGYSSFSWRITRRSPAWPSPPGSLTRPLT